MENEEEEEKEQVRLRVILLLTKLAVYAGWFCMGNLVDCEGASALDSATSSTDSSSTTINIFTNIAQTETSLALEKEEAALAKFITELEQMPDHPVESYRCWATNPALYVTNRFFYLTGFMDASK